VVSLGLCFRSHINCTIAQPARTLYRRAGTRSLTPDSKVGSRCLTRCRTAVVVVVAVSHRSPPHRLKCSYVGHFDPRPTVHISSPRDEDSTSMIVIPPSYLTKRNDLGGSSELAGAITVSTPRACINKKLQSRYMYPRGLDPTARLPVVRQD
jgi:hypothetical protein